MRLRDYEGCDAICYTRSMLERLDLEIRQKLCQRDQTERLRRILRRIRVISLVDQRAYQRDETERLRRIRRSLVYQRAYQRDQTQRLDQTYSEIRLGIEYLKEIRLLRFDQRDSEIRLGIEYAKETRLLRLDQTDRVRLDRQTRLLRLDQTDRVGRSLLLMSIYVSSYYY